MKSYLEGGGCAGGVSLRGRPPAKASDRNRTSNSSCNSPFSETCPDRLPELCSASLQVPRQVSATGNLRAREYYTQGETHYCEGAHLKQTCLLH